MNSLDVFGSIDREGYIQYVSGACKLIIGYESAELIGRRYTDFLHPDDLIHTIQAIQEVFESNNKVTLENRYIHKEGHAVSIHWSGVWLEGDGVLYCAGRDVTKQKIIQSRLEESEQRYRAFFDNGPDIVFVESQEGRVTEVNRRFKEAFKVSEEQVIGSPASCFLSPDMASVNAKYLEQALLGNSMRFDLELEKDGRVRIYDTLKHPIIVNNEITGVQNIVRDITSEVHYYETVQRQAKKLSTIFESITDAFFTLDRDWNFTYINSEAARLLTLDRKCHLGENVWKIFPDEVNGEFYQQCHRSIATGKAVHFEAYCEGSGMWAEVKAFPSEEGLSVYFNDVTEKVKARQELEKLSLVASKITHGVIIMNADGLTEWVNEGFTGLTGFSLSEMMGRKPGDLLQGEETDKATVQHISEVLKQAVPFSTKIIYYKKSGEKLWFSMDITPIFDDTGKLIRFITIQKDITERVKAQQEIKKLSLVASNTTNGVIITDRERRIEWVNKGFEALTGFRLEEAVGRTPSELLHNPNTDEKTYESAKDKMISGEPVSFEIQNSKKDGEQIWLSVQVNPIHDVNGETTGFITIQTDITASRKSLQELKKLSLVASKANNGVLVTDKEWRIEWVNEGFTRLTGYRMEEAIGRKPSEFLHNNRTYHNAFTSLEGKLMNGDPVSFEILNTKKSGEEVWLSVEVSPVLDESGEVIRYIEVQTDITALKRSELELAQSAKDLYRHNKDLQQFTYIVSHNLRAPVANALGLADLLVKIGKGSEMYDMCLSNLNQSVLRLDTVLRDINTILSIRDSKGNLEQERININSVIQQALSSLQDPLQKSGGEVIVDFEEGHHIMANRAYLYSVFYNLLSNAIKYRSEAHPLVVRIRCFGNSDEGMIISFSDNGSGFDIKKADGNIFKLYKRFHTDKKGRGIGLYLVKTHLEAMGGHIEVNSQVGVGTRFIVHLPKT